MPSNGTTFRPVRCVKSSLDPHPCTIQHPVPGRFPGAGSKHVILATLLLFLAFFPRSVNAESSPTAPSLFLQVGHSADVTSVAFSPDGKTLASGSFDNTIKLWDASTGELKQTLEGLKNGVYAVAFSPDGMTLASGSGDTTIQLWNATTGVLKQTLLGHSKVVSSVAFSPAGKTLASGSLDNTIKLWDAATGELKQTLRGHTSRLTR